MQQTVFHLKDNFVIHGIVGEIFHFTRVVLQVVEFCVSLGLVVVLPAASADHFCIGMADALDADSFFKSEI